MKKKKKKKCSLNEEIICILNLDLETILFFKLKLKKKNLFIYCSLRVNFIYIHTWKKNFFFLNERK